MVIPHHKAMRFAEFLADVPIEDRLREAVEWISLNMEPGDVFDPSEIREAAGISEKEDE